MRKLLPQLVGTGFQVLFHSPPGVLFTFPSQYFALSVTREYLALRGGPRSFPQNFTCIVVLWISLSSAQVSLTGLSPSLAGFSKTFLLPSRIESRGPYPTVHVRWFGLPRVRSPLLTGSLLFSFPPPT